MVLFEGLLSLSLCETCDFDGVSSLLLWDSHYPPFSAVIDIPLYTLGSLLLLR